MDASHYPSLKDSIIVGLPDPTCPKTIDSEEKLQECPQNASLVHERQRDHILGVRSLHSPDGVCSEGLLLGRESVSAQALSVDPRDVPCKFLKKSLTLSNPSASKVRAPPLRHRSSGSIVTSSSSPLTSQVTRNQLYGTSKVLAPSMLPHAEIQNGESRRAFGKRPATSGQSRWPKSVHGSPSTFLPSLSSKTLLEPATESNKSSVNTNQRAKQTLDRRSLDSLKHTVKSSQQRIIVDYFAKSSVRDAAANFCHDAKQASTSTDTGRHSLDALTTSLAPLREKLEPTRRGKKWNNLKCLMKSMATIKQEAAPNIVKLSNGTKITISALLRMDEIFISLCPDTDGRVPIAQLSKAITLQKLTANPKKPCMESIKAKISLGSQTFFTFCDLLKLEYPYSTSEDLSCMRNAVLKKKEYNQIRELDPEFVQMATETFDKFMDPEGSGSQEVNYANLLDGLSDAFPDATSIQNVTKTMDLAVLKRLREGGTMTKNEFIIWHSNCLNESQNIIWTPDEPASMNGTANCISNMKGGNAGTHDRSQQYGRRLQQPRFTPNSVLSRYLSSFELRQKDATAAAEAMWAI